MIMYAKSNCLFKSLSLSSLCARIKMIDVCRELETLLYPKSTEVRRPLTEDEQKTYDLYMWLLTFPPERVTCR
jgi:hypothetical protein